PATHISLSHDEQRMAAEEGLRPSRARNRIAVSPHRARSTAGGRHRSQSHQRGPVRMETGRLGAAAEPWLGRVHPRPQSYGDAKARREGPPPEVVRVATLVARPRIHPRWTTAAPLITSSLL